ncbi:HTH_Tnp_Tc3_2 domain-containing protein [Trichonephila clavipes]|nr:HTH_Tnp_Tc3_2 domain-containing protein [Trichonephila clavipes]
MLDHLEDNICRVIADIRPQMLEKSHRKLKYIRASRGSSMQENMFKIVIERLECGRTQLEVSEELGITQSVISRFWQRFQDDGWLVWGGIILGSRTGLHVQSVTITGHIYRDVILEQHARFFRGTMGAEFQFMDDNARPHRGNTVDECLQPEDTILWIEQHAHRT